MPNGTPGLKYAQPEEADFTPDVQVVSQPGGAPKERWSLLGRLAPAVVAVWVVLDLLARFLNPSFLHLDPWLVVTRWPPRYAPFAPDQRFFEKTYTGGNVRFGNLQPTEIAGPITFSTDRLGFRNNPSLKPGEAPQVLFVGGDSFIYGVGLSDEQTLPSVMTEKFGIPSYNAARFADEPDGMPELDWLLDHLPTRPSTVVYTYLEHRPLLAPAERKGWQGALLRRNPELEGDVQHWKMRNTFFWMLSPSKVITTRFFNSLSNDRFFPNEDVNAIRSLTMPDGRKLLFCYYEFELPRQDRGVAAVEQTARGFEWLQAEMKKRNLHLVVLLMPNRYTVYAPVLTKSEGPWVHYLDRLAVALDHRGIQTVNGLPVYAAAAEQELQADQLSFYREDAHWNPRGVVRIAAPLADALAHSSGNPAVASSQHAVQ